MYILHLCVLVPGMACCARYSADDDWYRAKVKSVTTKNGDGTGETVGAEVFFVDYGTSEAVQIDRYKHQPAACLHYECCHTEHFYSVVSL